MKTIIDSISKKIDSLESKSLNSKELDELISKSQELTERLVILRYKAYEQQVFGTFQEETETVEFGIKASSYQDNHAVKAITYYYKDLFKRYKAITSLKEKILIWIMPPEWEPKSIQSSQSIAAIANSNTLERNSYYLFGVISLTINILFFFLVLLFKNTMPKQYLFGYSIYYISNMLIAYKLMFLPNMRYKILLLLIKSIVAITVVLFVYVFINHQLHLIYFAVSIVCQLLIFLLYKLIK